MGLALSYSFSGKQCGDMTAICQVRNACVKLATDLPDCNPAPGSDTTGRPCAAGTEKSAAALRPFQQFARKESSSGLLLPRACITGSTMA